MQLKNTDTSFGAVAKSFHWLIALLVIVLIAVGLYMKDAAKSPDIFKLYALHKSFGVVVLALVCARMFWRLGNPVPKLLGNLKPWEAFAAKALHWFFYAALLAMPLSGWIRSSAANYPVSVFGLFTLPNLVGADKELGSLMKDTHRVLGTVLIYAIALHAAAALKHHFINKDATLKRMLPFIKALVVGGLILALTSGAWAQTPVPAWVIDPAQSHVTFKAKQMGAEFQGEFKTFTADIAFDPKNLDASHVRAEIDIASIDTAYAERDGNIKGLAWFDSAKFPKAVFESTGFQKDPASTGGYIANGKLTLRDVTKDIVLPFSLAFSTNAAGAEFAVMNGDVTLDRSVFGIGSGEWADSSSVAFEVPVHIQITAQKQTP